MKKIVLLQILLLLIIIAIGVYMKITLRYQYQQIHEWLGVLAGIVSVMTVFLAFKQKQSTEMKQLTIAVLVFISIASLGGHLIQYTVNFFLTYGLMEGGAVAALGTSVVMLKKNYK